MHAGGTIFYEKLIPFVSDLIVFLLSNIKYIFYITPGLCACVND
jgi:hypothetical protein